MVKEKISKIYLEFKSLEKTNDFLYAIFIPIVLYLIALYCYNVKVRGM